MPIGNDHHIASNKLLKIGCQLETYIISTYVLFIYLDMSCLLLESVIMALKNKF
jgi:hypothetical protein